MTKKLVSAIATLLVALGIASAPALSASAAASISAILPAGGVADGASANIPVTVTGVTFAKVRVSIKATNGNVAVDFSSSTADVTPGYESTENSGIFSGSEISFSVAKADAVSLLANHFSFTSTQTAGVNVKPEIAISITEFGIVVDATTGHTYVYSGTFPLLNQKLSWQDAQAYAATTNRFGHIGYLANITTDRENTFIATKSGVQNVWIGATDDPTEVASSNTAMSLPVYAPGSGDSQTNGHMVWGAGSERGLIISDGLLTPVADGSSYMNWATGEPNNHSGSEGCGVTNWQSTDGKWNDLDCTRTEFYMVEYDTDRAQAPMALTYDSANALASTGGSIEYLATLALIAAVLVALGVFMSRREQLVN